MKMFEGFERGMGIGGWLTNYKRFEVMEPQMRTILTTGDWEHFDTYITQKDVEYIASLGMDHIRLGFDQIVLEQTPFVYSERIFEIIEQFVHWCEEAKLNVILNLHKCEGNYLDLVDSVSLCDSEELQDRFVRFWLEFERRFARKDFVAFELLNESKEANAEKWNKLLDRAVAEIRKKNPTRKILLGAGRHNQVSGLADMRLMEDENIAYTFHFYTPHEFTHQRSVLRKEHIFYNRSMEYPATTQKYVDFVKLKEAYWNRPFANPYEGFDRVDKEYLRHSMRPLRQMLEQYPNVRLYCSEFGVIRHCDITYRENWLRDVISLFTELDIGYGVWNYLSTPNDGNKFSLVDDDKRLILSETLAKIIRGEVG